MTLMELILALIVLGFALTLIPMEARIRSLIIGITALGVVLWIAQGFGFRVLGHWR